MEGFLNCDLDPGPTAECLFDCQEPWPFPDASVDYIYCSHTLEHLPRHLDFFRHAWRVMKPMSELFLRMPYGHSTAAMADLTHLRPWYPTSFAALQPGYEVVAKGNHYGKTSFPFYVLDTVTLVPARLARWRRWSWGRRLAWWMVTHLNNIGEELWVTLQKTTADTMPAGMNPGLVPCLMGCWKGALEGKPKQTGMSDEIVRFAPPHTPMWR